MNEITRICPLTDAEAAHLVSGEALTDLAELIVLMPIREDSSRAHVGGRRGLRQVRSGPARRHWPTVLVVGAVTLAAVVAVITFGRAGSNVGPVNLGPADAQALSFTTEGRNIIVIIRNPYADPAKYRAEFKAHHLNITLQLLPASPSLVGSVVAFSGSDLDDLRPITATTGCKTQGRGHCPIGIKVPSNYSGVAQLTFGRTARPGEQYDAEASATAPGEVMHGLAYEGKTVGVVLAMLKKRDVTVPQYRWQHRNDSRALRPDQVPHDWIVEWALPWALHQVLLFVQPGRR